MDINVLMFIVIDTNVAPQRRPEYNIDESRQERDDRWNDEYYDSDRTLPAGNHFSGYVLYLNHVPTQV